jgi:hypothetical protein
MMTPNSKSWQNGHDDITDDGEFKKKTAQMTRLAASEIMFIKNFMKICYLVHTLTRGENAYKSVFFYFLNETTVFKTWVLLADVRMLTYWSPNCNAPRHRRSLLARQNNHAYN